MISVKGDSRRPRLLFVVAEDYYFVSHRLQLAVAAQEAGYDVSVATHVNRHGKIIRDAGLRLFPVHFNRSGVWPPEELRTIRSLVRIYRSLRPDLVHHVAMKPVIYGAIAARIASTKGIVHALGGVGFLFASEAKRARIARLLVRPALKSAFSQPNSRIILQNHYDRQMLVESGLVPAHAIRMIRGAGVDLGLYGLSNVKAQPPLVILPARLLWDKGVGQFVKAAKVLKQRGVCARFALVGRPDLKNPSSVSQEHLDRWNSEGIVEIWGWREDMPAVFGQAQIVCLPTYYGEGLPKTLLEAAAVGAAIVTTNIPGCVELIRDGDNGILVSPKDVQGLADALQSLIENIELRSRLGLAARETVREGFTLGQVVAETLDVYAELLK